MISCVILNYNDYESTIKLCESIVNYKNIDHIIIVDNNSKNQSVDEIRRKFDSIDKVTIIANNSNRGYGAGNNLGIKYSINHFGDEYCIISNPDIIFEEKAIISMLNIFKSLDDNCALVAPKMIWPNHTKKIIAWKIPNVILDIFDMSVLFSKIFYNVRHYRQSFYNNKKYAKVDSVPGSFFMVKNKFMERINYFDERFFLFEEEKIISTKLKKIGGYEVLDLESSFIHNHGTSISKEYKSYLKRKRLVINSRKNYIKYYTNRNYLLFFYFFVPFVYLESLLIDMFNFFKYKNRRTK